MVLVQNVQLLEMEKGIPLELAMNHSKFSGALFSFVQYLWATQTHRVSIILPVSAPIWLLVSVSPQIYYSYLKDSGWFPWCSSASHAGNYNGRSISGCLRFTTTLSARSRPKKKKLSSRSNDAVAFGGSKIEDYILRCLKTHAVFLFLNSNSISIFNSGHVFSHFQMKQPLIVGPWHQYN